MNHKDRGARLMASGGFPVLNLRGVEWVANLEPYTSFFSRDDGPFLLFLPHLGWFEALLSLLFLCVLVLVALQVARPWALRLCFSSPDNGEDP
jgi:hypothetical protein